jgi:hypothetical protein
MYDLTCRHKLRFDSALLRVYGNNLDIPDVEVNGPIDHKTRAAGRKRFRFRIQTYSLAQLERTEISRRADRQLISVESCVVVYNDHSIRDAQSHHNSGGVGQRWKRCQGGDHESIEKHPV